MSFKIPRQLVQIGGALVVIVVALALFAPAPQPTQTVSQSEAQVFSVFAKAGYTPNEVIIPAGKPAVLRIKTTNTYDCSAAFKIADLGVDTLLPANGETDFAIPAQEAGKVMAAGCSMGMYDLKLTFQ